MSTQSILVEIKLNDLVSGPLNKVRGVMDTITTRVDNLGSCFKRLNAIDLQAISQSAQNISQSFEKFNGNFVSYQSAMAEVSAITGVTGIALEDLGKKAKSSAEQFGGEATDSLNTYKILLSRLGPDIAKSPKALAEMERNVRILSKTMGNDALGSVDALTTAMLQYGVDLSNPLQAQQEMTRMMNIMAAGAKEGASEVPSIADALKVAGVQAKQSNVSFAETNAVLQELSKGGKNGSEAGTALRNVLAKMSGEDVLPKEAILKLRSLGVNMSIVSNTSLPLTTRLRELKKAQSDATAVAQVFGVENAAAANIMMSSVNAQDILKGKIENTNVALEQANIMMDTQAEKQSRWNAFMNNAKITLGAYTAAFTPYVSAGANTISVMADLKNAHEGYKLAMNGLKTMLGLTADASILSAAKTKIVAAAQMVWTGVTYAATVAQTYLNAAMSANPIGVVIIAITALIAVIGLVINYWDSWGASLTLFLGPLGLVIGVVQSLRTHWDSITQAFQSDGILAGFKRIGIVLLDVVLKPIQQLLELIAKIPGLGGLAGGGAKAIQSLRAKMDLVSPGEKTQENTVAKKVVGIAKPKVPGIIDTNGKPPADAATGGAGGKTNDAIATGGTKNTVVNITIQELNGVRANIVQGTKEAIDKAGSGLEDAIMRTLAMASSAAS